MVSEILVSKLLKWIGWQKLLLSYALMVITIVDICFCVYAADIRLVSNDSYFIYLWLSFEFNLFTSVSRGLLWLAVFTFYEINIRFIKTIWNCFFGNPYLAILIFLRLNLVLSPFEVSLLVFYFYLKNSLIM